MDSAASGYESGTCGGLTLVPGSGGSKVLRSARIEGRVTWNCNEMTNVDPLIGQVLDDRFELREIIGIGGMGVVYRAHQMSVGRDVAIKVISAVSPDSEATGRFLREGKLASHINHPNTVTVYDFGQTPEGLLYLVMELVTGPTLKDKLSEDGAMGLQESVHIAMQLADALNAVHTAGIIHRDLKPSNLVLVGDPQEEPRVKLLDFGLARHYGTDLGATVTREGVICGTMAYMPPEVAKGLAADERSDIYSLGVILYEMLSGVRPFQAATTEGLLAQVLSANPKPLPPDTPPVVSNLVMRLIAREPAARCDSAATVRELLIATDAHLTTTARSAVVSGSSFGKSWFRKFRESKALKKLRQKRWFFATLLALCIGLGIGIWAPRTDESPPSQNVLVDDHGVPAAWSGVYSGKYRSTGSGRYCTSGTTRMTLSGNKIAFVATSDAGMIFTGTGTMKQTGDLSGTFNHNDTEAGSFRGERNPDGTISGTTSAPIYGCTGSWSALRP